MRKPRIGLLVPYVSFYEKITPLRAEKELFAAQLGELLGGACEVIGEGLVDSERAARAAGEAFLKAEVDAVIVAPTLAVFGALPWAALEVLPPELPIAIWHLAPLRTVPVDYEIRALIRNSAALGAMALGNTLARRGRVFRVFDDRPQSGALPETIRSFLFASRAASGLRCARLGLIGSVFPQMTDILIETGELTRATGAEVIAISPDELTRACLAVSHSKLEEEVGRIKMQHPVDGISDDELRCSLRVSLALDGLVELLGLNGGAFNCHGENCLQNPALGVTGCYAVSKQTSEGRPFSCTGDLPTAVALFIARQLAGATIYGELEMVDEDRDCVLLANGGEGDAAFSTEPMKIFGNENFAGLQGRGASVSVTVPEGATTLLSFTPLDSRGYRLIVAEGALDPSVRTALKGFHTGFRFAGKGARRGFRDWLEAGATHHLAVAPGRQASSIKLIGEIFHWEVRTVAVDEEIE
jgi:L-fucose isomerase-like protein